MALSLSSVLHYWSARYGSVPVVGGKPVHARSSAGRWIDQQGILQNAIVNTPRFEWADLGDGAGRRAVMRLEQARTNSLTYSEDWSNAAWVKSDVTISANAAIAPDGTLTADKLIENTNNVAHWAYQAVTYAAVPQSFSVHAKAVERTWLYIRGDFNSGREAWFNLATGAFGTVHANFDVRAVPMGGGWYRILVSQAAGLAGTSGEVGFGPTTGDGVSAYVGVAGNGLYLWGAQHARDCAAESSYIQTVAGSGSRATDDFSWAAPFPGYNLMAYVRFIERGTVGLSAGARLLQLSKLNNTGPRLIILNTNGPNAYQTIHDNGSTSKISTLATTPAVGATVELLALWQANGSVDIAQSINGAAVTSGGVSAAQGMNSLDSIEAISVNGIGGSYGLNDFAEVKIVKYPDVVGASNQARMDELRSFELGPNGAVL